MAKFDAEELGKRLDELNREQLATLENLTEKLLNEMRRKSPIRVEGQHHRVPAADRQSSKTRQQPPISGQRVGGQR